VDERRGCNDESREMSVSKERTKLEGILHVVTLIICLVTDGRQRLHLCRLRRLSLLSLNRDHDDDDYDDYD